MDNDLIKRELLDKIIPWLGKEKILIIKGARQVGKTVLLNQLQEYVENKFKAAKTIYLAADDLENQSIFSSPRTLVTFVSAKTGFPNSFVFLFIDEFQYIPQAGRFLKNIFDKYKGAKKLQIIVSGSSSLEVAKNQEFLTGRALEFNLERVSFREFFRWREKTTAQIFDLTNFSGLKEFYFAFKPRLKDLFQQYIIFGGYPEVLTAQTRTEKEIILKSIVKTYIEKDVAAFLKIENVVAFNKLLLILSEQIGNLVNISELANTLDISIPTVKKYLSILEGTYIFRYLSPYYQNKRKEIIKMPKVYLLDFGIKSYLSRFWDLRQIVSGAMAENFVYLTLLSWVEGDLIYFYRTKTGTEIDFVVKTQQGNLDLIEVKYSHSLRLGAFKKFFSKYPGQTRYALLATKDILDFKDNFYYLPIELLPFVRLG